MNLSTQKRITAKLLKIGRNKVKFDTSKLAEIKEAITKTDLRILIKRSVISKKKKNAQSKVRVRHIKKQKSKGRRKGQGSRKGTKTARTPKKMKWMIKVRSQRNLIKGFKNKELITPETFRSLYKKIKGNLFRSKRHIKLYLKEKELFKKK